MELEKTYCKGSVTFVPHAVEAEDFVGTVYDDHGEHRHIVPRDEAKEWVLMKSGAVTAAGFIVPVEVLASAKADSVPLDYMPPLRGNKKK